MSELIEKDEYTALGPERFLDFYDLRIPGYDDVVRFAAWHHRNQRRKYTGKPYIVHPVAVARSLILDSVMRPGCVTEAQIRAAILHDTVEDTEATLQMIRWTFGEEEALLVSDLTTPEDLHGNRAERHEAELRRLKTILPASQTVKYVDIIDNVGSVVQYDPTFAKVYVPEKISAIEVMESGDPVFRRRAMEVCQNALTILRG